MTNLVYSSNYKCLNCDEDNPCDDMEFTKERFRKKDGVLAYHGYQSFKEGEVTPDVAHEIGVKFAEEMFKDYEVVVATHQNTNHIHNHFIMNSVSFKSGKKYNNNLTNISKIRHISDSLCLEYGLSVLDEDKFYKRTYTKSILNDEDYKTLKEDLDNFAKNNFNELNELKGKRENFWRRYHRAKTEEMQTQILAEINDIQPKIKELYKYDKYCKEITKRAECMQNNLNIFDKDIQKEKDNSRSL